MKPYIITVVSIFVFYSVILGVFYFDKSDRYTNRIVEDIHTHKQYVQEINDLVEVGDTITYKIDTNWITVKVIK